MKIVSFGCLGVMVGVIALVPNLALPLWDKLGIGLVILVIASIVFFISEANLESKYEDTATESIMKFIARIFTVFLK